MKTFGERLRHARTLRKMTQGELSEKSGVKQGTISKIERDGQGRTTYIAELADALDIRIEWLKDNSGPMDRGAPERKVREPALGYSNPALGAVTEHLRELSPEQLDAVMDIIRGAMKLLQAKPGNQPQTPPPTEPR